MCNVLVLPSEKNAAVRVSFGKRFDMNVENESQVTGSVF